MSANLTATMKGTQTSNCFNHEAKIIGTSIFHCLVFVVSLIGNITIGTVVFKTKSMQRPINFFIVNMAMSDLLFPIFQSPYIVININTGSWLIDGHLGQALCKLRPFFPNISGLVSVQSLVLIAVDRFGAVVFPLRSPLISSKQCRFFILASWIIGAVVHIPDLLTFKLVESPERLSCERKWKGTFGESFPFRNYGVPMLVVFWYFPLVLIATLYLAIFLKLKSQNIPGEESANARAQHLRRERNVLKMSIAIVSTFAVCWMPVTIRWLLLFYPLDSTMTLSCGFQHFADVAVSLAHLNCAINPVICLIFSGNYRRRLKNLLGCCPACTRANREAA